jgi:hypothetical protein
MHLFREESIQYFRKIETKTHSLVKAQLKVALWMEDPTSIVVTSPLYFYHPTREKSRS